MRALGTAVIFTFLGSLLQPGFGSEISQSVYTEDVGSRIASRWSAAQSAADAAQIDSKNEKKKAQPGFKSLLIPGWAQLSTGRTTRAYIFLGVEVGLIAGMIVQRVHASRLRDSYRNFATQHAGVPFDKNHQYYVDIGNWDTVAEYNEQRLRFRQFSDMYTSTDEEWRWDTTDNRLYFKDLRLRSDRAGQRAQVILGGMLLNHLLAFVDAGKGRVSVESLSGGSNLGDALGVRIGFHPRR